MQIIIIGCGRQGSALAQLLCQRGHTVTIVDSDMEAFERLRLTPPIQSIVGIGFDREVLIQAGIERADGLAALTTSDEANVVIARIAKQIFRVPQVVARVYEPRKAEIYRRLGLQTISPIGMGAIRLAELLTFSHLDALATLGSGEVEIVQVEAPPFLVGRTVSELTLTGEVSVVAIQRVNRAFLPTWGTTIEKEDQLDLAVLTASSNRLKTLLGM
jgi:trk system potassium uptake protein TrkA